MIDHTGLQVRDPVASGRFYDRALAPLGYRMLIQVPLEHAGGVALGYGFPPRPDFWVSAGTPNEPRLPVAFRAETHQQVDEFYRAAIAAGGRDHGGPGPRPHYHEHYYGALVLDPVSHNIEAVCHAAGCSP